MLDHEFGGDWTEKKLEKLGKYLPAYTKIFQGRRYTIGYIDAFAGMGYRTIRDDFRDEPGLFDELVDFVLASEFKDIEDGFQYYCALRENIFVLLTRNTKDFIGHEISIMTCDEYLEYFQSINC